jgi:APA family basic amino acid/polyamine antiporter
LDAPRESAGAMMPDDVPPSALAGRKPAAPPESPGLARRLGARDLMLLVAGTTIGGGIFLTPAAIARRIPDPRWILAIWIAGGIFTIAGGLVYAELGGLFPEAGGTYLYIREAYGDLAAFLYGWIACFVSDTGAMAAITVGLAEYLGVFFPRIGAHVVAFRIGSLSVSTGQVVAIGAVAVLSATHIRGVREGVRIQGAFSLVIIVAMAALSIGGIAAHGLVKASPSGPVSAGAIAGTMIAVLFSYGGWSEALTASGEVEHPRRNIPLGVIAGTAIVTALYLGVNVAFLKTMSVAGLAAAARPAQIASLVLFGAAATLLLSGAIVAMAIGSASAAVVPPARIAYAMARNGLLPERFGRVHPRFRTPALSIAIFAVWTSILCLSGRYEQLFVYATFAIILSYVAAGVSIFVFRKKRPDADRPYRCWGYPWTPLLFVGSSLAVAVATIRSQPRETLSGLAIMVAGIPVYYGMRRKTRGAG